MLHIADSVQSSFRVARQRATRGHLRLYWWEAERSIKYADNLVV